MYKCLSAVAGLLIGFLFVINPAQATDTKPAPVYHNTSARAAVIDGNYYCDTDHLRMDNTFENGIGRNVYWQVTHYFRACRPYDPSEFYGYVTPLWTVGSYNAEGSHMTCNPLLRFINGIRFNMYFWRPYTGANFNPGSFYVPCDESTINGETQNYDTTIKLFFGPGTGDDRQPRMKVNVDEDIPAQEDRHQSEWRKFTLLQD
jgi:hypothetical protein